MTAEEYFKDWAKVINTKEVEALVKKATLTKETLCPSLKDIFKAFELCSFKDLRLVILGQDPYNNLIDGKPVATGIAFANRKETLEDDLSPSLKVLRKSIIDFSLPHGRINFDPSLEKWEKQGVLMLNSALTCLAGKPGSHSLLWVDFIRNLLIGLSKHHTGIVYVLMGNQAKSFEACINKNFNHIVKVQHPAWFARTGMEFPRYLWKEVNDILIGQNGYGINWYEETEY